MPSEYFQVLGRSVKDGANIGTATSADATSNGSGSRTAQVPIHPVPSKSSPLYGIVQYDFQAERPDELDAKAGEAIIVIAQSNHEWFVAKPIGRLGGPGLIPVSFIEIRDMATGQPISNLEEIAAKAAVPKVEEWKKAAAEYKNSSIPLGRFDFDTREEKPPAQHSSAPEARQSRGNSIGYGPDPSSDVLFVTKATVDQVLRDNSRYWFLVRLEMNDGRHRNLCRYYEDFYDFQIALLEEFPVEAGRTGQQRILPFMPGPLTYVDDTISSQRRADLSVYVEELCQLPRHVVRSPLVQELFSAREGDVESSHPTSMMPQPIFKASDRTRSTISQKPSATPTPPMTSSRQSQHRHMESTSAPAKSTAGGHERTASVADHTSARPTESFIKIKVFFEEDLIAIRVAHDIQFEELCDKLRDRLSGAWQSISIKDDATETYKGIHDDADFQDLLVRTDRIVLYVQ